MAEQTTLESLLEMGFGKNSAEKAVASTGNQGIERAMDWLQEHQNDPDIDEPYVAPVGNVLGAAAAAAAAAVADSQAGAAAQPTAAQPTAAQPTAAGTIFDTVCVTETAQKTEEKREKVKKLEELMRAKQAERVERERVEEVEREKQRRRQGQELTHARQKLQDEERMKLVELQRREKMEDKIAKERVKEKIARDREERLRRCAGGGSSGAAVAESSPPAADTSSPPTSEAPPPSARKEYDESRIQVRLLDGSAITAVFKAQESLAAVRVYVQTKSGPEGQDFNLLSPYPSHVYTEMDMEKPLRELGLVPSAVLIVTKKSPARQRGSFSQALQGADFGIQDAGSRGP